MGEPRDRLEDDPVCAELTEYLREHPNAMDTLDGIAEWWLRHRHGRVGIERVAQALQTLEARGVLERVGDGERALFRLRHRAAAGSDSCDGDQRGSH